VNYKESIYKLQKGINEYNCGLKIVYNQNQFYSEEKRKPVTIHSIKFVEYDWEKDKNVYTEAYKSGTQLFIVFFLRNLWYTLNGKEIPVTQFPQFEREWANFIEEYKKEMP
jgi:hypothetical protein